MNSYDRERLARWLRSKHSSLWGEAFDITKPDGLQQAVEWLVKQSEDYDRYLKEHEPHVAVPKA